jgi:hypothetical protein
MDGCLSLDSQHGCFQAKEMSQPWTGSLDTYSIALRDDRRPKGGGLCPELIARGIGMSIVMDDVLD